MKVYPHLNLFFLLAANTCTHQGPIFQQSKEAVHCGRFGALGTKLKFEKKMAPGRVKKTWLTFSSTLRG